MTSSSPIQELIGDRFRELGLAATDLIRRAGHQNIANGLRRVEALMNGDLNSTRGLIAKLPLALDLPPETIAQAVEETQRQIREQEQQA